jgi:hypothetical protein
MESPLGSSPPLASPDGGGEFPGGGDSVRWTEWTSFWNHPHGPWAREKTSSLDFNGDLPHDSSTQESVVCSVFRGADELLNRQGGMMERFGPILNQTKDYHTETTPQNVINWDERRFHPGFFTRQCFESCQAYSVISIG